MVGVGHDGVGVMLENTTTRWGSVQIGLHWTIAVLILLVQVPAGIAMNAVAPGDLQNALYNVHKNVGLIVFLLACFRLAWRWRHPVPYLPADLPAWQASAARATHGLLYALLFLLPITGFLYTALSGYPVPFLMLWDIAKLVPENKPLGEVFKYLHVGLTLLLAVAAALHVAGALHHHLVRKDGLLQRMLSSDASLPPRIAPSGRR
ncbi:MAG: cytochrome b/b6 domain-containing protein [Geminicoccaceae bacterium]